MLPPATLSKIPAVPVGAGVEDHDPDGIARGGAGIK
jgi:hypothetical protein